MTSVNEYIANQFIKLGVLDEIKAKACLEQADKNDITFQSVVLANQFLTKRETYETLGKIFGLPYIEVNITSVDVELLEKTNSTFMMDNRILPLKEEKGVVFALVDDPVNYMDGSLLQTHFNKPVSLKLIDKETMDDLLAKLANKDRRERAIEELKKDNEKNAVKEAENSLEKYLTAPAVALANTLLEEAVSLGASDIHIEPMEEKVRVRYRIDGILTDHCEVGINLYQSLLARYKIMSELDIAERRIPQDGKISLKINDKEFDFRISTLPLIYGEKIVIRIYNTLGDQMTVAKLAHDKEDERKIRNLIRSPHGIILLTGPTGSGKTTTLYAFLKELNKPGVNIQTVEDPVENQVAGVNQLQTNAKTGLTFAAALRSILRQDPNIIMVGEIRDEETAHIAVQAAITGHLVLSTIHTNDAVTTITRLIDMGVEPYLVSDSLAGAISQRLMRKLCPYCKKEHIVTEHEAHELGLVKGSKIYEPDGCPACNNTGYHGRVAVFEIMSMEHNVRDCIDKRIFGKDEMNKAAEEDGLIPLRKRAAELVKEGLTSIEEYDALVSHIGE